MTKTSSAAIRASLTLEQSQLLAEHGLPVPSPHRSTVLRRKSKQECPFPVISRSGRRYRQPDGRSYGEVDPALQKQADAKFWRPGVAVRAACQPMTVAVGGRVKRIWEVRGWTQDAATGMWVADLGRELTNVELDRDYPGYPYRRNDVCPTRRGGAYRPEFY